ncbi:hypothetical protein, partial [Burkholderia mallei]|uniref:hypothetical protein n=1 Tax=Burkholderia mallei TaxID=13373 RepID=UPI001E4EEB74
TLRRQSLRRNIGQPRTLLPLSRSWFKGTLLEAHWPYRRGQVTSTLLVLGVVGPAAGTYCSCEVVRVTVMLGILKDSNLNFVNSKTK